MVEMKKLILAKRCFKIDKINAKGMIEGFNKNGKIIHTSIWCDVTKRPFPMLITLNRSPTPYKGSSVFDESEINDFVIHHKYVALFDSQYFIKNEWGLWERICNNGLFDIWMPDDPYKRFNDKKICRSPPSKFRIILLRIYEIEGEFKEEQIVHVSNFIDHITAENLSVNLKRPIISDEEFKQIKELLEETIKEYR